MKSKVKSTVILALVTLALSASVQANEDPPGCNVPNGGQGNTAQSGINFNLPQAHVGDFVPLFPSLGMVSGDCRAINATGSVWIATGRLTNFLVNVTLDPGPLVSCPADAKCQPGPTTSLSPLRWLARVSAVRTGASLALPSLCAQYRNGTGTVLSLATHA